MSTPNNNQTMNTMTKKKDDTADGNGKGVVNRDGGVGATLLSLRNQPKQNPPRPLNTQQGSNNMMQPMMMNNNVKQELGQPQQLQQTNQNWRPIPPLPQQQQQNRGIAAAFNGNNSLQQQLSTNIAQQNFTQNNVSALQALLSAIRSTPAAPPAVQASLSAPVPTTAALSDLAGIQQQVPNVTQAGATNTMQQSEVLRRLGLLIQQPQGQPKPQNQTQVQTTSEVADVEDSQNQQKKQQPEQQRSNPPAADNPIQQAPNATQVGPTNAMPSSGSSASAANGETDLGLNTPKAPGTIILPCRARGMPVDHNFRTAHFVIPSTVGHGEDLICSYAACRNAGIKFRYCAACRVPVAKRNFHQRHGHGIPTTRKEAAAAAAASAQKSLNARKDELKRSSKSQTMKAGAAKASRSSSVAVVAGRSSSRHGKIMKPPTQTVEVRRHSGGKSSRFHATSNLKRSSAGTTNHKVSSDPSGTSASNFIQEGIPRARQEHWAELLRRRPDTNDADGMSAWLLEVMAVSDLKTPVRQGASSFTTSDSSSEISSYTDEPTSSLNSFTSSDGDFSSDVSSLGQEPKRTDAKKAKIQQKSRTHIPGPPTGSSLPAIPPMREVGEGEEERKRRKKKQRTFVSEEGVARKKPRHKSPQKCKVSSSKDYGNATSGSKRHGYTKEKKLEKKSAKAEGNYTEFRERKKQKALSKKKKSSSDVKLSSQH